MTLGVRGADAGHIGCLLPKRHHTWRLYGVECYELCIAAVSDLLRRTPVRLRPFKTPADDVSSVQRDDDWDIIAQLTGDDSWLAENVRQHFNDLERNQYLPDSTEHGYDGYISVSAVETMKDTRG